MLTRRRLEIFVAVCECGNMSKVAKNLLITQSSISQIVLDIEKEYGVKLFERMQNTLKLTPVGAEVAKIAKELLIQYRKLDDVLNLNVNNKKLRIGASITVSSTVLNPILLKFYKNYPDIKLHLFVNNTSKVEDLIVENKLDIALVEGTVSSDKIKTIEAMEDEVVFVCSNDNKMANKKEISLEDIATCSLTVREEGSGTREQIIDAFRAKNINNVDIVGESSSYEAIIKAVKVNLGTTIISKRLVIDEFNNGNLWMCPIKDFPSKRKFNIIYHKDKFLSEEMKLFIENCKEVAASYGNDIGKTK